MSEVEGVSRALVAGLGVDIVEVERMEQILKRSPRFKERVFTPAEQEYCHGKRLPAVHFATHFAAKEAVLKALGTGFSEGIGFTDVEVSHNAKGKPLALLHGAAAEVAEKQGIQEVHLSLSRTHGTAVANAIAVNEAARPIPPEQQTSPKEELAAAFKELRGILNELDEPRGGKEEQQAANSSSSEEGSSHVQGTA